MCALAVAGLVGSGRASAARGALLVVCLSFWDELGETMASMWPSASVRRTSLLPSVAFCLLSVRRQLFVVRGSAPALDRVIEKARQRREQPAPQRPSQLVEQPQVLTPAEVADCRQVEMFQPAKQQASPFQAPRGQEAPTPDVTTSDPADSPRQTHGAAVARAEGPPMRRSVCDRLTVQL